MPPVFGAQPWDQPFAAGPAEILKSASTVVAADAPVLLLLDDHRYVIQKDGRTISTFRRAYRIASTTGLEDWSHVESEWEPWHEARPELRARVISADGSVHWLDTKTVADAPVAQLDPTIFSDARVIRAPLPAVAVGAVVEYEITIRETTPAFAAGAAHEFTIGNGIPIERFHASLDAAPGIPLRVASSLLPDSAIRRTESKAGTHVEVDVGRIEALKDFEFFTPLDEPQYPRLRFSTGSSWQQIAASYQRIVNQQIASVDPKSLLKIIGISEVPPSGVQRETVARLTAQLHRQVRYTGVEFGEASILPNQPAEVLNRHYGDCKDKATLLVALLRASGLKAHVALLRAGESTDVDPNLPGFGLFNHAIVYVDGTEPLWIDPTVDTARIGSLPIQDQGRHALVVDDATTGLTLIPESTAADNRIIHHIEIQLSNNGKGFIRETVEARGSFELAMRQSYSGDDHQVRAALERFAKNAFAGGSLGEFSTTKKDDFSQPFRLMVEAKDSSASITGLQDAFVRVSNSFLFENLPFALRTGLGENTQEQKSRKHDFVFETPYHAEVHFKIQPPPNFNLTQLPPVDNVRLSGITYHSEGKQETDGSIRLEYEFEIAKRRLSPVEFQNVRSELSKRLAASAQLLTFSHKAADLIALGKTAEALQIVQQDARKHPDDALSQMRLAHFLMNSGAGEAALIFAQRAVDLDPNSEKAWLTLAYASERDSFGRLRTGDWKPAAAESAVRKAIELDTSDLEPRIELPILLEYGASGERYAKDARLSEAVSLYREVLKISANPVVSQNLTMALMHLGRYDEAEEESRKFSDQPYYAAVAIALTALRQSPDRAIINSQSAYGDNAARAGNLSAAAYMLSQLRKYEAGEQLLRAAQRLNNDPKLTQMLNVFGKMRCYEDLLGADDDPKTPVQRFLILAAKNSTTREELTALLNKRADSILWQRRLERVRKRLSPVRMMLRMNGGSGDSLADFIVNQSKLEVLKKKEDSPVGPSGGNTTIVKRTGVKGLHGSQVDIVSVTSPMSLGVVTFFVVHEDGHAKLLGTGDGLEAIGTIALDAVATNDLATAQEWLDAAKNNALPESPDDDKGPAIRYLWAGTAPETRNAVFARAAAASLLGTYSGSPEAIAMLKEISVRPPQYMQVEDLEFAICEALNRATRWEELRVAAQKLLKRNYYKEPALRFLGHSLIKLQQWPELARTADAQLAVSVKDHTALQLGAIAAMAQGNYQKASQYLARLKDAPGKGPNSDDVLRTWNAILAGNSPSEMLANLNEGNIFSAADQGATYIYTLALAQLRTGKPEDCNRTLALALEMEQAGPSGLAWLVQREILKYYHLDEFAAVAADRAQQRPGYDGLEFAKTLLSK